MMFLNKRIRPAAGTLEIGDPESDGAMGRRRRVQAGGLVFDQVNGPGGGSVEPVREVTQGRAMYADTGPKNTGRVAALSPGEFSVPVANKEAGGIFLSRYADPQRQGGMSVEPSRLNWSRAAESLAGVGGTLADAAIRPPDQGRRAAFLAQRTPVHVQGNTTQADRSERLAGVEQGRTMARERQRYVEPVEVEGRAQVDVADRVLTGQKYVSDNTLTGVRDTNATTRTTTADTNRTRLAQQGMILRGTEVTAAGQLAGDQVRAGAEKYRADKGLEGQGLIVGGQKYAADAPGKSAKELRELDARTAAEFREDAKATGGIILPASGTQYVSGGVTPVKLRQQTTDPKTKVRTETEYLVNPRTGERVIAPDSANKQALESDPIIAAAKAEIKRQGTEMAGGDQRTGLFNRKSRETVIAELEKKIAAREVQLRDVALEARDGAEVRKYHPGAKLKNGEWFVTDKDGKEQRIIWR